MRDFLEEKIDDSTSASSEIHDDEADDWGFLNACEAASLLFDSLVYDPGFPGEDRSSIKIGTDTIHRTCVVISRRYSGAGGTQQVLLTIGPKEVWEQLHGVEIFLCRLDTGAVMARSKVGEEAYVRFPDVSFRQAYYFRLVEPVSE